ncbi:SDR family NAD(P)-dependent oxidoreductase [Ensifer adhaerens]|uniref:SDR family NAD(P)-dependent oxidoreductase n=1 Tax=Ensifer adhaerens TaxID=106592 RepID=UPI000CF0D8E1|nr:SDR family oxidoreductase [Ensifer adhaerens]
MANKVAIITGASQGIGAGLTNAFLAQGYDVVATSRNVSKSGEISDSDRLARVDGDIADPDTAKRAVDTAIDRFGSIDALVNNAGIFFTKPFVDYTAEDYRQLSATNIEGFIHTTQLVAKQMLAQKRGGSIVSITTPLADRPIAGMNASVAMLTKGGINAISKNIAMEYARDGIRVNVVAPGVVDTPLHKDNPRDFLNTLSPMHSISSVDEIVDAVLFLTRAPRITGEVLNVDGGAHLGKW